MMKRHLQQLQLYREESGWAHQKLKKIRRYLLPKRLNGSDLATMVDEMAKSAKNNQYLHSFLIKLEAADYSELTNKVKLEGDRIFPDVVAYAMVLNRLVGAMIKDIKVLRVCHDLWTEYFQMLLLMQWY